MQFKDIKQLTKSSEYRINQSWSSLESFLAAQAEDIGLNLDPDYQRDHVWTREQEIRFVEWILRGGVSGRDIYFNSAGWMGVSNIASPLELVDGKQRLKAVLGFLRNEIPAFGTLRKDYEGRLPREAEFIVHINDLKTKKEVMQWYVDMNAGGTIHTEAEIAKVREMIAAEKR